MLTDEQCKEFIDTQGIYKDVVRAIHNAGQVYALTKAAKAFEG